MAKTKKRRLATLEQAFGQIIFARREKKGLKQVDLAVASGYSLRYIGELERGEKSATMRTMHDLATLLNVRLSVLIVEAEKLWMKDVRAAKRASAKKRSAKSANNGQGM